MSDVNKHWSGVSEAGSLLGMRFLLLVYRLFGRWGFRLILLPVISYFYLTRRQARQASAEYLARLSKTFPECANAGLSSVQHFWCFGEILLDKLLVWMGRIHREDVVFATPEVFDEVDSSTCGGVILVSHLGNTEVCSALAHQLPNIKITMLVHTRHAVKFNALMQQTNSNACINLMQVTDMTPATAMLLSERVAAGEYVVIAADRTPVNGTGRTSMVDFLGGKAAFPQGAFILAGLLGCPVYLLFCLKHEQQYHLYLELFATKICFNRRNRSEQIQSATQAYAKRLEYYCQLAPLQWFNFFPFWQAVSTADDSQD
ncbi:lipid A biosynthesis acyltransferase [Amphritea opalescens]|uniref:Lipid A biosynthesis acyltransferase n=1 Tax=Amphritea opalescens TaxID=2490544 RepID=A0A430KR59_9GAMM|nr:lipid A biosynthesis acyltransferase [Amphritea opalescens]RTE65958.1 lipid A biosynthesis acyltransferase [Amphritea opalescens]